MTGLPSLSVLLSVYAGEQPSYLDAALRSVWHEQTSRPDQIVLVLDGPLGPALDTVVQAWKENLGDALTVVPLAENGGLAAALNAGLPHCRSELVARMDTNDVALPGRFASQAAFMAKHPEIAVASGQVEEWDERMERRIGERRLPLDHDGIRRMAVTRNPINHPAAIYRKSAVLAVGGYPFIFPEDYPLWCLMLMRGDRFANLDEVLVRMRTGEDFLARRGRPFLEGEMEILKLQRRIGMINTAQYLRNRMVRHLVRRSPDWLRRGLYKYARG